jgi:hypothetical protein
LNSGITVLSRRTAHAKKSLQCFQRRRSSREKRMVVMERIRRAEVSRTNPRRSGEQHMLSRKTRAVH